MLFLKLAIAFENKQRKKRNDNRKTKIIIATPNGSMKAPPFIQCTSYYDNFTKLKKKRSSSELLQNVHDEAIFIPFINSS